jgi:hypothetical protein
MASPVADSYTVGAGQPVYAGRANAGALGLFIASMSSGEWAEYTGTNINTPLTGADSPVDGPMSALESKPDFPSTNWATKFGWDQANHIIYGVATCQGFSSESPAGGHSKAVWFDTAANEWSQDWNPTGQNEGHAYDGNTSIPMNGLIYRRGYFYKDVFQADPAVKTWASAGLSWTGMSNYDSVGLDVFPDFGASGSLILVSGSPTLNRIFQWDIATGSRTELASAAIAEYPFCVYVPGAQKCLIGGNSVNTMSGVLSALRTVDNAGSVASLTGAAQSFPCGKIVASPANTAHAYGINFTDNTLQRIDLSDGSFTSLGAVPSALVTRMEYAVGVALHGTGALCFVAGGLRSGGVTTSKMFVYKV